MDAPLAAALAWLEGLPSVVLHALLGTGAALENIVPPIPADTFVLLGGFLASRGTIAALTVFLVTWLANVGAAFWVYSIGHRRGRSVFENGWGRRLVNPRQFRAVGRFYDRWGVPAIFLSRFLPGLRAVVPVFAGVTHQPPRSVLLPIAAASAVWYGALVRAGYEAGRNLDAIVEWLADTNRVLLLVAGFLTALIAWAWLRTRSEDEEDPDESGDSGGTRGGS